MAVVHVLLLAGLIAASHAVVLHPRGARGETLAWPGDLAEAGRIRTDPNATVPASTDFGGGNITAALPAAPAAPGDVAALLRAARATAEKRSYVVYLDKHAHGSQLDELDAAELAAVEEMAVGSHHDLLGDKEKAQQSILYSYTNGFVTNLDAAKIARQPGTVSVFPDRGHRLPTTRSLLSLAGPGSVDPRGGALRNANLDLDTESESFRDHGGLGPVPSSWNGKCEKCQDDKLHYDSRRRLISNFVPINTTVKCVINLVSLYVFIDLCSMDVDSMIERLLNCFKLLLTTCYAIHMDGLLQIFPIVCLICFLVQTFAIKHHLSSKYKPPKKMMFLCMALVMAAAIILLCQGIVVPKDNPFHSIVVCAIIFLQLLEAVQLVYRQLNEERDNQQLLQDLVVKFIETIVSFYRFFDLARQTPYLWDTLINILNLVVSGLPVVIGIFHFCRIMIKWRKTSCRVSAVEEIEEVVVVSA